MKSAALLAAALLLAAATPLHAPSLLVAQLPHLHEIRSVSALPQALRDGDFAGAGGAAPARWSLADPGAPFNSGDAVSDPSLPSRELVFAACDPSLCVLHYRLGGSGESDNILALTPGKPDWRVIWFASGHPPLPNLDAFKRLLGAGSGKYDYTATEIRRDLF